MTSATSFPFDNTYAAQMAGFYLPANPAVFPSPILMAFNEALAEELGLDSTQLKKEAHLVFSGQLLPEGATPIAQAYAGHQFGGFSSQLGDGRAMMLGEVVDKNGLRRDIQLKGSGPTPFSRGGDGKASVGPVLREYLVSASLHALGVPTTRMLAAVSTGQQVYRERPLPGAVVTRVAASHLRVGTFEFFAARGDRVRTKQLADYAIKRHYPHLLDSTEPYLGLLSAVSKAQADLIAGWMCVGFIHGVMNTDNFTIAGETIDFGPCAFMDTYDRSAVFSSIDYHGRYAYGNQPRIGQWNLARFAEVLLPLINEDIDKAVAAAQEVLEAFTNHYQKSWVEGMRTKLGLTEAHESDHELTSGLTELLEEHPLDYTSTLRSLSSVAREADSLSHPLLATSKDFNTWGQQWLHRLDQQAGGRAAAADRMDTLNPVYIPRNHHVEEALRSAVEDENLEPFERLLDLITHPFEVREGCESYAEAAPSEFTKCYKTYCGT
jgi:uncharacterized protein YdiU (UPF0061 family)